MSKKSIMICGLGGHARGSWIPSIKGHPNFELTGIIDTDTELLENVEQFHYGIGEDQVFRRISDIPKLGTVPDVMVIATPIYTHHVLVKEAIDIGCHVICEKNMASTIYQGRQMVQLALDHPNLATAVGVQRRYNSSNWALKQYLNGTENQIGTLNFIQWNDAFNWGAYRDGWRQFLPELFAEDQMVHWFDLIRYITEMDIVQVYSDSFIPRGIGWQGSSTVIANLALAKPQDYHHRHNWVWCRFYGDWQRRGPRDDTTELREFCGTKGKIKIRNGWLETYLYQDEGGTKWEEDGIMPNANILGFNTNFEGQKMILEQVNRCIDSNGKLQPDNNFRDVFKSFAAVMGAIESSRSGRAIYIPDYWKDLLL